MSYTGNPLNNQTDRIRLNVGDTDLDEEGLSDNEYAYIIHINTDDKSNVNELSCTIKALNLLMTKYANCVDEVAGKLAVKYSQLYTHYRDLLDYYTKDPRTALYKVGTPFTGGIYVDEICSNKENTNTVSSPLPLGWSTDDFSSYN